MKSRIFPLPSQKDFQKINADAALSSNKEKPNEFEKEFETVKITCRFAAQALKDIEFEALIVVLATNARQSNDLIKFNIAADDALTITINHDEAWGNALKLCEAYRSFFDLVNDDDYGKKVAAIRSNVIYKVKIDGNYIKKANEFNNYTLIKNIEENKIIAYSFAFAEPIFIANPKYGKLAKIDDEFKEKFDTLVQLFETEITLADLKSFKRYNEFRQIIDGILRNNQQDLGWQYKFASLFNIFNEEKTTLKSKHSSLRYRFSLSKEELKFQEILQTSLLNINHSNVSKNKTENSYILKK